MEDIVSELEVLYDKKLSIKTGQMTKETINYILSDYFYSKVSFLRNVNDKISENDAKEIEIYLKLWFPNAKVELIV